MFDHVTIRVSDRAAAERFYDLVLGTLGLERHAGGDYAEWGDFGIAAATSEHPVTQGLHVGFFAASRGHVEEFWRVGTAAGYDDDGAPGLRPQYRADYYGSFLRDGDGNSVEAVHHGDTRRPGSIDHLWIRVGDLDASRRFYETIAPHAGLRRGHVASDRVQFRGTGGSFSVVDDQPLTKNLHMAFGVATDARVEGFHRAAVDAGYEDNGAPGERPVYHAGYYSAYVLDPDENNIEVVNHHREEDPGGRV